MNFNETVKSTTTAKNIEKPICMINPGLFHLFTNLNKYKEQNQKFKKQKSYLNKTINSFTKWNKTIDVHIDDARLEYTRIKLQN